MVSVQPGVKPIQCPALLKRDGMPDRRCFMAVGHVRDHACFTGSNNLTWTNEERVTPKPPRKPKAKK